MEYLDQSSRSIVAAVDRARREVDLLREYRTRLIADVVTGKLDVREAASKLPDEADESDWADGSDPSVDASEIADPAGAAPDEEAL